jgi:hypothetical protein
MGKDKLLRGDISREIGQFFCVLRKSCTACQWGMPHRPPGWVAFIAAAAEAAAMVWRVGMSLARQAA